MLFLKKYMWVFLCFLGFFFFSSFGDSLEYFFTWSVWKPLVLLPSEFSHLEGDPGFSKVWFSSAVLISSSQTEAQTLQSHRLQGKVKHPLIQWRNSVPGADVHTLSILFLGTFIKACTCFLTKSSHGWNLSAFNRHFNSILAGLKKINSVLLLEVKWQMVKEQEG